MKRFQLVAAGVAVVLLALTIGMTTATATSLGCGWCHRAQSGSASAHHGAQCQDCHLERGAWDLPGATVREFFVMVPAKVMGKSVNGPSVPSSVRCASCHTEIASGNITESNGLRIKHVTCAAPPATCSDCHSSVPHGSNVRWQRPYSMQTCMACHKERGASTACNACHVGTTTASRPTTGVWQVTHGPQWKQLHGLGDLSSCSSCHSPDYCAQCHGVQLPHPDDFGTTHGQTAKTVGVVRCETCHSLQSFCNPCHQGIPMPHPTGFLKVHSSVAQGVNDPRCQRCHVVSDCETCHTRHVHPGGPGRIVPSPELPVPTQGSGS